MGGRDQGRKPRCRLTGFFERDGVPPPVRSGDGAVANVLGPWEPDHGDHRSLPIGNAQGPPRPGALFTLPVAEGAAQSPPSLGYAAAKSANPKRLDVFKQGLAELGYVDGKNIRIDYREGVLDADYHTVMAEFVGRKVNIILAANAPAAVAAAKATSSVPIVMLAVNDPVGLGLVKVSITRART